MFLTKEDVFLRKVFDASYKTKKGGVMFFSPPKGDFCFLKGRISVLLFGGVLAFFLIFFHL